MDDTLVFSSIMVAVLLVVLAILRLRSAAFQDIAVGLAGAIVGLVLGALASVPLRSLPTPLSSFLPLSVTLILTLVMIVVALLRKQAFIALIPLLDLEAKTKAGATDHAGMSAKSTQTVTAGNQILVDTSAIIDGRIADIATAGFVPGTLIVPRFVLAELQNIADSEDAMRRGRGRRGLEVLNRLRETPDVVVEVTDEDVSQIKEVDAKLVALAQRFSCNVLTTDYNLNRVAAIQGVRVLNVNELSNAIRPVVLPGEELLVRVVQPGKERGQGVGYLADGTMIVVENGDKLIGQEVSTEVTRVFQTVAGKMIFAAPRKGTFKNESPKDAKVELTKEARLEVTAARPSGVREPQMTAPEIKAAVTQAIAAATPQDDQTVTSVINQPATDGAPERPGRGSRGRHRGPRTDNSQNRSDAPVTGGADVPQTKPHDEHAPTEHPHKQPNVGQADRYRNNRSVR